MPPKARTGIEESFQREGRRDHIDRADVKLAHAPLHTTRDARVRELDEHGAFVERVLREFELVRQELDLTTHVHSQIRLALRIRIEVAQRALDTHPILQFVDRRRRITSNRRGMRRVALMPLPAFMHSANPLPPARKERSRARDDVRERQTPPRSRIGALPSCLATLRGDIRGDTGVPPPGSALGEPSHVTWPSVFPRATRDALAEQLGEPRRREQLSRAHRRLEERGCLLVKRRDAVVGPARHGAAAAVWVALLDVCQTFRDCRVQLARPTATAASLCGSATRDATRDATCAATSAATSAATASRAAAASRAAGHAGCAGHYTGYTGHAALSNGRFEHGAQLPIAMLGHHECGLC